MLLEDGNPLPLLTSLAEGTEDVLVPLK